MFQKKSKILIYFVVGIASPCLLLSYLAFRGIQNDRALVEQQTLNQNQRIAQSVVENIHHRLNLAEQAYVDLYSSLFTQNLNQKMIDSLQALKTGFPLIEEFFSFQQATGGIELLTARLLFILKNNLEISNPSGRSLSSPVYLEGMKNEFQQQSYHQAIKNYQQAYSRAADWQSRAAILNARARVEKKAGHFHEALKSYQKLSQEYGAISNYSGIPLGLAAQHEIGFIYLIQKDTLSAIQVYLNAFNQLLHGSWLLERSQYNFWSQALKDSLHKIFSRIARSIPFSSYQNTFKRFQEQENIQKLMTDRLLNFQDEAAKPIVEKISLISNDQVRFAFSSHNQKYFLSLLTALRNRVNGEQKVAGILWQADVIKNTLVANLSKETLAKQNIVWRVVDEDNQVILKANDFNKENTKLEVKTSFINNFPDWTLEFYHKDPLLIEQILASRRSIYFYVFMLIAGILIFGSILTIRSVTHELELAKMKSDFVSSISHELKSPLTSIRQLAEMLQRGRVPSQKRRQKYYDVIVEQSEILSLLINNVLDYARMEAGSKRFYFEPTAMENFLKEILATIQGRVSHDEFVLELKIDEPLPPISVDRIAISQAITNLLDNAIKYSDRIKKISVHLFVADHFLNISVQDFGIGVKKEEWKKIFDRFYRVSDEFVRSKKGSGLGLTLVKQIVAVHYGLIEVVSEPGRGSTFTIKLPIGSE